MATTSPVSLSLSYRAENKRFSTLKRTKTGDIQPKLNVACFVQSCFAVADFVIFSNYCLIGTRLLRSVFCLRLIAEKQTCFCGLKIVILPFCPKACGSLLPTAFLTCAKKRVISENCPYSIVDVSASGCDKYVRILVRLLFQRLKRLGYVRLFVGFVPYVVVAINFEVVFVLLFFHYGFYFFHP